MRRREPRSIYQHASRERDVVIAEALSDIINAATPSPKAVVVPLRDDAHR